MELRRGHGLPVDGGHSGSTRQYGHPYPAVPDAGRAQDFQCGVFHIYPEGMKNKFRLKNIKNQKIENDYTRKQNQRTSVCIS